VALYPTTAADRGERGQGLVDRVTLGDFGEEWLEAQTFERAEHLRHFPAGHDHLVFISREHKPLNRNHINGYVWRPALIAAGVEPGRGNGMHALGHF
jgi:hypothetical protein